MGTWTRRRSGPRCWTLTSSNDPRTHRIFDELSLKFDPRRSLHCARLERFYTATKHMAERLVLGHVEIMGPKFWNEHRARERAARTMEAKVEMRAKLLEALERECEGMTFLDKHRNPVDAEYVVDVLMSPVGNELYFANDHNGSYVEAARGGVHFARAFAPIDERAGGGAAVLPCR